MTYSDYHTLGETNKFFGILYARVSLFYYTKISSMAHLLIVKLTVNVSLTTVNVLNNVYIIIYIIEAYM